MSDSFWQPSEDQRRAILLLEALGLIHDLGKLSDTFLKSQDPSPTLKYNHNLLTDPRQIEIYKSFTAVPNDKATNRVQKWLNDATTKSCAFGERPDLTAVLGKVQFTDWTDQEYSFAELTPLVARPGLARPPTAISPTEWQQVLSKEMQPGLLIGRLHGPAHIEKEGEPKKHKQPYSDVFRATPFGLETGIETGTLTNALKALPLADIEQITTTQRSDWLAKMKAQMSRGLADNRRPHNEVSLWDWGYTVATLTKAAAASIFKNDWPSSLDDLSFCTLRINLNILERYTHSDKISDLLGVRDVLYQAFRRVRILLEETWALSNRFYHDETGAYYLLPDIFNKTELASLREEIQAQFPPDLCPQVHLGEPITVGQLDSDKTLARKLVADPRSQALREMREAPVRTDNNLYLFESEWAEEGRPENSEPCMVCGVRPVGYPCQGSSAEAELRLADWATQDKAEQRNVCRVCLDRRDRRAQEWATGGLQKTIWTDEVADDNGRLALFVGKLGLDGWLDGKLLSTIQVTSKTAKNPSPARLYRIAETARAFWEKAQDKLLPDVVKLRPFRLALYPTNDSLPDLGDYHACELEVNGVALSVVWDKPNKRFLTVDNLTYFAERCGKKKVEEIVFKGRTFRVLEPSAFLQAGRPLTKVAIREEKPLGSYLPTIPLLAEPSVCLMLVPADKALELARTVKREYEQQMGKVRDRLPLYLGLVFCNRRTPIRAVLEAGRAMLNMNAGEKWEGWGLIKSNKPDSGRGELIIGGDKANWWRLVFDKTNIWRELYFDTGNGITWRIPLLAGDGKTVDEWYPRLHESNALADWLTNSSDKHADESKRMKDFKLVKELRVRDPKTPSDKAWKVWVRPSRFDFEFLDTTGRRFEIYYDPKTGRRPRRTRPFYLEDLDRLDQLWELMERLKTTQRHQVIRTIEATRETWHGEDQTGRSTSDEVFRQFVADTLAQAEWPKDKSWSKLTEDERHGLIEAGVRGELADLAELHMEILKDKEVHR